jgi:hypothetical protein
MAGIQDELKDEPVSVPLMVVENGCGSPCIDFLQVSSELAAAAAKDADLVRCLLLVEVNVFSLCIIIWNILVLSLFDSCGFFSSLP